PKGSRKPGHRSLAPPLVVPDNWPDTGRMPGPERVLTRVRGACEEGLVGDVETEGQVGRHDRARACFGGAAHGGGERTGGRQPRLARRGLAGGGGGGEGGCGGG